MEISAEAPPPLANAFAAAVASFMSCLVGHPLDTLKLRL